MKNQKLNGCNVTIRSGKELFSTNIIHRVYTCDPPQHESDEVKVWISESRGDVDVTTPQEFIEVIEHHEKVPPIVAAARLLYESYRKTRLTWSDFWPQFLEENPKFFEDFKK